MIEFKPFSIEQYPDALGTEDPDGAYLAEGRDENLGRWQITIVGPMQGTPGDYVDALERQLDRPLDIVVVFVLPPASKDAENAQEIWRRGFLGIQVRLAVSGRLFRFEPEEEEEEVEERPM
jgi:hypothetical protein